MNRDELQSKIHDLIVNVTIDPSGESIEETTREIMNLVDGHEHAESVKPTKFLFSFITMKNGIQNGCFKRICATGKTREDAEKEARLEVYKLSRVWPDEIILLECKELD